MLTSATLPRLDVVHGDLTAVRDVVIVAHGGSEHSYEEPTDLRPPLLRMWPFASAAVSTAPSAATALIRYRYRGWNGEHAHAGADLRTTLRGLPETVERIVLIGHSMGGRAVFAAADDRRVAGVLGLAPWLPSGEPVIANDDAILVTAHGTHDSVTDPAATGEYVRRLRAAGHTAAEFAVDGDTHAMLYQHRDWTDLSRQFVRASLSGDDATLLAGELTADDVPPRSLPLRKCGFGRAGAVAEIATARTRFLLPRQPRPE